LLSMADDSHVGLAPAVEPDDDLARLKALALDGVSSLHSRRAYEKALDDRRLQGEVDCRHSPRMDRKLA
jgi:hypothetical protein